MISLLFFCVLAVGLTAYYVLPQKFKWIFLLLFSWALYFHWNSWFLLMLIGLTFFVWVGARAISRKKGIQGKTVLILEIIVLIGAFYLVRTGTIASKIGLSFYSFQAIGYLMDIYRGKSTYENNFFRFSLFMNFFPVQMSGPIERGRNFLPQIREKKEFNFDRVLYGVFIIIWGLIQKLVIADRCAIYVNYVYENYGASSRLAVLFAVLLYSVQIYTDFAGYSDIALGTAYCFGYKITRNFNKPYFAAGIKEFWRRWHISLTSWLTDYVYISLGGSRKGLYRTYVNIIIVFLVSGIWHGQGLTFLIWGLLHGIYQVTERCILNITRNKEKTKVPGYPILFLKWLLTFGLVSFAWIFFRSASLGQAAAVIKQICFGASSLGILGTASAAGMDIKNLVLLVVMIAVLILADVFRGKGIYRCFRKQKLVVQWMIAYVMIFTVIIFGIYGPLYDASGFIYSQF